MLAVLVLLYLNKKYILNCIPNFWYHKKRYKLEKIQENPLINYS